MIRTASMALLLTTPLIAGCARLDFNDTPESGALLYYEPEPYFLVTRNEKCEWSSSVVSVPGKRRSVGLQPGYGSSELAVSLSNGMIASVNQKVDTKIPETINAGTGFLSAAKALSTSGATTGCEPASKLFPIVDGRPDTTRPVDLAAAL